jgi:hypothetical protein
VEPRQHKDDIIGYRFDLEELKVYQAIQANPIFVAYLQTVKANFVTDQLMIPLLQMTRENEAEFKMALNEAYLKGAVDVISTLLEPIKISGDNS